MTSFQVYRDGGPWLDAVRLAVKGYRRRLGAQPTRLLCHADDLEAVTAAASRFEVAVEAGDVRRGYIWSTGNE